MRTWFPHHVETPNRAAAWIASNDLWWFFVWCSTLKLARHGAVKEVGNSVYLFKSDNLVDEAPEHGKLSLTPKQKYKSAD